MSQEERLIDIEIKITRQEDTLDALNQLVYLQQKKIDELERLCATLASHVRELREIAPGAGPVNEKPPHY